MCISKIIGLFSDKRKSPKLVKALSMCRLIPKAVGKTKKMASLGVQVGSGEECERLMGIEEELRLERIMLVYGHCSALYGC